MIYMYTYTSPFPSTDRKNASKKSFHDIQKLQAADTWDASAQIDTIYCVELLTDMILWQVANIYDSKISNDVKIQ